MTKWEYHIELIELDGTAAHELELFGNLGWEAYFVERDPVKEIAHVWFKRPKEIK